MLCSVYAIQKEFQKNSYQCLTIERPSGSDFDCIQCDLGGGDKWYKIDTGIDVTDLVEVALIKFNKEKEANNNKKAISKLLEDR